MKGQIYTGKINNVAEVNQEETIVIKLSQQFLDKILSITSDNFFTSMSLALYLRYKKLHLLAPFVNQENFLPPEIFHKSKVTGSIFLYHDDITLCNYSNKPGKNVLLMRSLTSKRFHRRK